MKRVVSIFLLLLFISITKVFSIGSYPFPITITQPDGSEITIKQNGDEFFHWTSTLDGYRIVKNEDGVFEYAKQLASGEIVPSGIKATSKKKNDKGVVDFLNTVGKNVGVTKQSILKRKAAYISKSSLKSTSFAESVFFPNTGNYKLLVILVTFSDTVPTYSQNSFNNLMNQPDYGGTGSFRDFYLENSNNLLDLNSTVTDWVTVSKSHDYYGPDAKTGEFVYEAIAAVDGTVDFSEFDNDGDGIVESVIVIHQGKGEEGSFDFNDIWSHSLNLSAFGYSTAERTFDGVVVNDYTINPEIYGNTSNMTSIGVVCHEFGHTLGGADYYDVDYGVNGEFDGTGYWDLMAIGAYNNSGKTPAHHNPYTKQQFGWITTELLESPKQIIVEPLQSSQKAYRYNTTTSGEYFLIENRQKQGFDINLPGEGLIIYHVDSSYIANHFDSNDINASSHQGLYIKAAGGSVNDATCSFPGTENVIEFTDATDPSSLSWNSNNTNKSVTGIYEDGDNVVFDFMAQQDGAPQSFSSSVIDFDQIRLNWERSVDDSPVLLVYSETNTFGQPANGTMYAQGEELPGGGSVLYYGSDVSEFNHLDLTEVTTYYYRLWSYNGANYSVSLTANSSTTAAPVSSYPWSDGFEDGLSYWTQEQVVGSKTWITNSGGYYSNPKAALSGAQNAFFFSKPDKANVTQLISPKFIVNSAMQKYRLEFYHAQKEWDSDQDNLRVLFRLDGETTWTEIANYNSSIPFWMEKNIDFTPGGDFEIAFEGEGNYGYGIVIDQVKLFPHDPTPPTNSSTNLVVSNQTLTSMTISWTPGDGDSHLLVGKRGKAIGGIPDDGIVYNGDTIWGYGDQLIDGEFIFSISDTNEVTIYGLQSSSTYYFSVFDYDSSNLFYQQNALTGSGETSYGKTKFTFNITDEYGVTVSDALITINDTTKSSDVTGTAMFYVDMSGSYQVYEVEKDGYDNAYGKFIAQKDSIVNIVLLTITDIAPLIDTISVDYKDVVLKWNPVINENFAGYEPFSTNIPNWTFIDNDGIQTYGLWGELGYPNEGYTGSFIVMDPYSNEGINIPEQSYSNNQFLGCVAANGAVNDDWIISPEFSVQNETWLSFAAKSNTDEYGLERLRVLVSISDTVAIDSFNIISANDYIEVPIEWTKFKYDLSAYQGEKIRFAINCVSDDAYMLLLDQIAISSSEPANSPVTDKAPALQRIATMKDVSSKKAVINDLFYKSSSQSSQNVNYEVYRNGNLLSTIDSMAKVMYIDSTAACGIHTYQVKTVFTSPGISEVSEEVEVSTCLEVLFVIEDDDGVLSDVTVIFDGINKITNSDGEVVFSNIAKGENYSIELSALDHITQENNISISNDTTIIVAMEKSNQIEDPEEIGYLVTPNPTNGVLHVNLPINNDLITYTVYNLTGVPLLLGSSQNNKFNVDLFSLQKGVYILEVKADDVVKRFKIQKL